MNCDGSETNLTNLLLEPKLFIIFIHVLDILFTAGNGIIIVIVAIIIILIFEPFEFLDGIYFNVNFNHVGSIFCFDRNGMEKTLISFINAYYHICPPIRIFFTNSLFYLIGDVINILNYLFFIIIQIKYDCLAA